MPPFRRSRVSPKPIYSMVGEPTQYKEKEISGWGWARKNAMYILAGMGLLYFLLIQNIITIQMAAAVLLILVVYVSYKTRIFQSPLTKKEYVLPDQLELVKNVQQYLMEQLGERLKFLRLAGDPTWGGSAHTPNVLHFEFARYNPIAEEYCDRLLVSISVFDYKNKGFGIIALDRSWYGVEKQKTAFAGYYHYPIDERVPIYQPIQTRIEIPSRGDEEEEEEEDAERYYEG